MKYSAVALFFATVIAEEATTTPKAKTALEKEKLAMCEARLVRDNLLVASTKKDCLAAAKANEANCEAETKKAMEDNA